MGPSTTKKGFFRGFSLIEIMFAIAIFAFITIGVFTLSLDVLSRDVRTGLKQEVSAFAQEGIEAARFLNHQNPLQLVPGTYGLSYAMDSWTLTANPDTIENYYTRSLIIDPVYRDNNGDIVDEADGTLDPLTKKITSRITWDVKGLSPQSYELQTYMNVWFSDEWNQTTCTEFAMGTYDDTVSQPAAAPPADNCVLELEVIEEAGTFFVSVDIGQHGNDVEVDDDYAYVATHKNTEGLSIVEISDVENPNQTSSLDVAGKGRYVFKNGNILYMGVEKDTQGLAIVNVADPANPAILSTADVGGYGNEIVVANDILYMGVANNDGGFAMYNVSNPSSPSLLRKMDLDVSVEALDVQGNYAFVGTNSSTAGFQVINVADPANPWVAATLDVDGTVTAVKVDGIFAYVGTSDTDDSLHIINIADPANPFEITSLDVTNKIEDIGILNSYLYVTLNQNDYGLGVVNVGNPAAPYLAFTVDTGGKGTGVDINEGYIYVGIDVSNAGLVVVDDGNISVAPIGTYISSSLDTGSEATRYLFLDWEGNVAPGGSISFQIRTASSAAGLTTATWVGPDGTGATDYTEPKTIIALDPNRSGQRYIQIRAEMTSDGMNTSAIEEFSIHYLP